MIIAFEINRIAIHFLLQPATTPVATTPATRYTTIAVTTAGKEDIQFLHNKMKSQ